MNGTVVVGVGGADSAHFVIRDNFFDPASVTVKPGGKLGWENQHNNAHTATRP
jgi:plastocyanin